jgi:hypothetical protein
MEALGGSSYSFTTSALDGGEWSASLSGRALPPVPIGRGKRIFPVASAGDRTFIVQSVTRHYTDWATPASNIRLLITVAIDIRIILVTRFYRLL